MDIQMPLMNGYEATKRYEVSIWEKHPIIAVTAGAEKRKEKCIKKV
jgi:CheY-like chemotaxis protein